jgi:hypothetical protein
VHDEDMFGYVLIAFILVAGPLAILSGVDSRVDEKKLRQRFSR